MTDSVAFVAASPTSVRDLKLKFKRKGRGVAVGCVVLWLLVGWMFSIAGLATYGCLRVGHSFEARRRRGDEDAITLASSVSLVLIPVLTTVGAAIVSVGAIGVSRAQATAYSIAAVVLVAVIASMMARGLADHQSGRRVLIWDPTAKPDSALAQLRRNYSELRQCWFPSVAQDRALAGVKRADDMVRAKLTAGKTLGQTPSAFGIVRQYRGIQRALWAEQRVLLVVSWVWSIAVAVLGVWTVALGNAVDGWVIVLVAALMALGLPLAVLPTYAQVESDFFLARMREHVLVEKQRDMVNSAALAARPSGRIRAFVVAFAAYRATRIGERRA